METNAARYRSIARELGVDENVDVQRYWGAEGHLVVRLLGRASGDLYDLTFDCPIHVEVYSEHHVRELMGEMSEYGRHIYVLEESPMVERVARKSATLEIEDLIHVSVVTTTVYVEIVAGEMPSIVRVGSVDGAEDAPDS